MTQAFDTRRSFSTPGGVYNATPSRIIFGAGTLARVVEAVEAYGAERAVVVSTPGRRGLAERVVDSSADAAAGSFPKQFAGTD